jgi:hypothetical protein
VTRSPAVHPALWGGLFGVLTAALLLAPQLAAPAVTRGWAALAALTLASALLSLVRPGDRPVLDRLAVLLPPGHRTAWRAEAAAVLAACEDPVERRRQWLGFVAALPTTAVCCWRLRLARRPER